MSASGLERALDVGRSPETPDGSDVGHSALSFTDVNREARAVPRMAAVEGLEPLALGVADDDCFVGPVHGVGTKLVGQCLARGRGARNDHHPARSLVEPVHDSRARVAVRVDHVELDSLKQTQGQQSIDECAPRVPASGVDDKTGGLIYHHELVVHVQQFKADVGLGQCFGRGGRGGSTRTVSPSRSRAEAARTAPPTVTRPSAIHRCNSERDNASASARKRSSLPPLAFRGTTRQTGCLTRAWI